MECKIRRYRCNLLYSGTALILFSLWSLVKPGLNIYIQRERILAWTPELSADPELQHLVILLLVLLFLIFGGGALLIDLFIGTRAIRAGQGRPVGRAYPILCGMSVLLISFVDLYFWKDVHSYSVIVDATDLFARVHVLYSSFRLRQLQRG